MVAVSLPKMMKPATLMWNNGKQYIRGYPG